MNGFNAEKKNFLKDFSGPNLGYLMAQVGS